LKQLTVPGDDLSTEVVSQTDSAALAAIALQLTNFAMSKWVTPLYYVINRNINFTNIMSSTVVSAFRRDEGEAGATG